MKDVINETVILKIAQCPSVSGKSTLTYHIGRTEQGGIQVKIHANTAAGYFSQEWVSLDAIEAALAKGGSHFTSIALQPLFKGKPQNNAAFLLAILLKEGLVGLAKDKQRCYQKLDAGRFKAETKALIADDKPVKQSGKAKSASSKAQVVAESTHDAQTKPEPQG